MEMEDRRVRKTKKAIRQAFWELAGRMPMENITIKEICELADINRSSFYFHYLDLPDLISDLSVAAAQKAYDQFEVMYSNGDYPYLMLENFISLLESDPEIRTLFLNERCSKVCTEHFSGLLENKVVPYWMEHSHLRRERAEYIFRYMIMGTQEMIREWYRNGQNLNRETFLRTLSETMIHGLFHFVQPEITAVNARRESF